MLDGAHRDTHLSVCGSEIGYQLKMLAMIDNTFASSGTATHISVLNNIYTKRLNSKNDDM